MKDLAAEKGVSSSYITELHKKALNKLRQSRRIRDTYAADYYTNTIRHKGLAAFKRSGTSEIEDYVFSHWKEFPNTKIEL